MENGKIPKMVWDLLRSESDQTLGEQFWGDILGLMPNIGPRIDVFQTEQHVVVVMELAGLDSPKNVRIKLKDSHLLLVQGDIRCDYPLYEGEISQSERFFGEFQREILLPHDVTSEQVNSAFNNGLLTVRFTKKKAMGEELIPLTYSED